MWTTAISALLILSSATAQQAPEPRAPTQREVTYTSSGAKLAATLLLPASAGRAPAVVIVHGSGDSDRTNPWTAAYAQALVERGIAVLHPDKRGCGKSEGDWKTASFEQLADDVARAVEFLRAQPEVDASNVGLIGFSQGVDVAPVCAARPKAVDFVIAISGSVVPLIDQIVDEIELEAERAGKPFSPEDSRTVRAVHRQALAYARTRAGWDELQARLKSIAAAGGPAADGVRGLPGEREHWVWSWIAAVGDFDPLPHWKEVAVPMLFVYGGRDTQVRGAQSVELLRGAFAGSERNWCALELALNGHALSRPDVMDFAARWIRDHGAP